MDTEYNIDDIICNNHSFNFSLYHRYNKLLLDDNYQPLILINENKENHGAAELLQACRDCNRFKIKCRVIPSMSMSMCACLYL